MGLLVPSSRPGEQGSARCAGPFLGSSPRVYCRTIMREPVTVEKFAIGQSVRRVEDPRLLRGFGRYSDDVSLPHQAYAVVVRSPHAHAVIRSMDRSAARQASGVLAVLTGADLAADGLGNLPTDKTRKRRDGSAAFATPRPALVRDRARHVGDPVALVVAATPDQAVDAAELVAVDYEPLPAVAATADAARPGAPPVWAEAPDNVAFVWEAGNKDAVARAFASAAHVTHLDFVVSRVAAAPLEPRGAVGEWDRRTGRYTLHTGIQAPHGLRTLLADQVFRVPQMALRNPEHLIREQGAQTVRRLDARVERVAAGAPVPLADRPARLQRRGGHARHHEVEPGDVGRAREGARHRVPVAGLPDERHVVRRLRPHRRSARTHGVGRRGDRRQRL